MKTEMKTICFFGIHDPEYSRNRILEKGFRENGWNTVQCRVDPKAHKGFSKYAHLIKAYKETRKYLNENHIKPDMVLVAFPGHTVVWLARVLFFRHKIFFDAFLSRFDSNVYDRKSYKAHSLRGIFDWILDWSSCWLADRVLLDTEEHIRYFSKHFFVNKKKMIRVPVGADSTNFYPRPKEDHKGKFIIYFHGMFIPLQGLRYIVDSAFLLKDESDIIFNIIGNGQEYKEISKIIETKKLSNVFLLGVKSLSQLPEYINQADICLGIFGETDKAQRVIPNKVYEYIAMKKPVITADTPAIKEFFINEKDMLLCKHADAKSLAEAILRLKDDPQLASFLAENAYNLFNSRLTPRIIVSNFLES